MVWTYSTLGEKYTSTNVLVERRQRNDYLGGLCLCGRIILKWILEELGVKQWTELP